ncbi:MAG: Gfo/Idh/MocA family protein [Janthinobacterium lividum]
MQVSSGATLAALAPHTASAQNQQAVQQERQLTNPAQPAPSGPPVKFASVGIGIEGAILLRACMTLPNAQCVAACDVYDARHTLAKEIAGGNIATSRDIKQTLADPQIEAIVLAVPDHQHAPLAIEALHAGKDVYCEKPMSHSIADGEAMMKAVQSTGKFIQVGSQRVSSVVFGKARELCSAGAIGPVHQVELLIGRNTPQGAWEYPLPPGLSPENLDWAAWLGKAPKHDFDPITFARWRCFHEYGTGMAGDLMVHLLTGMQYITGINQMPDLAVSVGGIVRWPDGRNMPDLMTTMFMYGKVPVTVRLTQGTEYPETTRVMGPHGIIEVQANTVTLHPQLGVDRSPDYGLNGFPAAMHAAYEKQWHAEHDAEVNAHPFTETQQWLGPNWDDQRPHLSNFFNAVRSRQPVVEDVVFGHHAAGACHMANASYFEQRTVKWDGKKVV